MAKKTEIVLPKIGMDKDSHPSQLKDGQYTHAKNSNIENESGNSLNIKNEKSNILATKFKEGFVVINQTNDIDSDNTYFFLLNPQTGTGEFGVVPNNQNTNDLEDITSNCDDCTQIKELATPLENINQTELQTYTTLISDDCIIDKSQGFNFSLENPILKTVIKNEKCGKTIYFSHKGNPPRHINIDNIQSYFIQEVPCGEDIVLSCPDFNKMRVFKLFNIPKLTPSYIQLGGNLKNGVYEFLIAYCDIEGRQISEYFSITNPIRIFDENNKILSQSELANRTNFAIKLNVSGLDTNYTHYKIAVIQTSDIEGATRYFIEGIHTINDIDIIYNTEQNKQEVSVDELFLVFPKVEEAEGVATANNILYQYGITNKKEYNLQPIVNFLGELAFKWQTHIAPEDLYQDGVLSSKYMGYNRDEVVPFGIRFLCKGGYVTSDFPLIGRKANTVDLETISEVNKDRLSLESNLLDCNSTLRDKRWQIYNTATVDDTFCFNDSVETIEVQQLVTRYCTIEDIATIPSGTITIETDQEFSSLVDYINDNKGESEVECNNSFSTSTVNICSYLYDDYSAIECTSNPFGSLDCGAPTVEESIDVSTIENEQITNIYKEFPTDYRKILPPQYCNIYKKDNSNNFIQDPNNPLGYVDIPFATDPVVSVYLRDSNFYNEDCEYSYEIPFSIQGNNNVNETFFNNYYVDSTLSNLLHTPSKTTLVTDAEFQNTLHKGALWFEINYDNLEEYIVDFSKQLDAPGDDGINGSQNIRVNIFKNCTDSSAIYSKIFSANSGEMLLFKKQGADLIITDSTTAITTVVNGWSTKYKIAIDTPIVLRSIETDPSENTNYENVYIVTPTDGCYTVTKRDVEIKQRDITWDSISLKKTIKLEATCTFNQPVVKSCQAIPYKKGEFAYVESTDTYPDNSELWDSSTLTVEPSDIPVSVKTKFENVFVENLIDYTLNQEANFTCKNIRHFKMPDNIVAPFMWDSPQQPFSSSIIFPLGVTMDEEVVNSFLDIAVKNNLISQKERDEIIGYEIVRGDLNLNRSIIASGLLYDMRKYNRKGEEVLYSNYPFNSYSADKLNLDSNGSPLSFTGLGIYNNNYTFHSPETDYYRPTLPTEISLQGYVFGNSKGNINEVLDHPKSVILTSKARNLASDLATLEVVAEAVIQAAQATSNAQVWFVGGFAYGTSLGIPAFTASGIILAFQTITAAVFKYGRYRYEWLKIFEDLGTPYNFAYYQYFDGYYNYLQLLQEEGEKVRGLNISKYIKDGEHIITNQVTGDVININNSFREESVFLSTGDYEINYPNTYKNYDKDIFTSSLTYSGENGISNTGKSETITRNIASPYIYLKNYLPAQHGTINSIKWLTTGYRGDLTNPRTDCLSIFGGDTFIERHSLKRKHSQFLINAMNQSDRTPFNYYFYNNIGTNPQFYLSSGVDKDFSGGGKLFPDIENDFIFDNTTKKGNYYNPPSKFYLYYYGIPSFLCETRINTSKRYGQKDYNQQFREIVDIDDWTQEKNVSIREKNWFFYNSTYSKQVTPFKSRMLPTNYKKEDNDCRTDFPNGVISSLPDNSENNTYDPWLIYRPLDFYEFRTDYGKLKNLTGIENEAVLARFENTSILFNKVDYTNDDGQNPTQSFLGGTSIFQRRSASFYNAQIGFGGTQNTSDISCEFGHFHVDAKRGQVIQIPPQGGQMEEISSMINGKPSGMRQWFKEHLPFKILRYFKEVDINNHYNGFGISMGWDSRFRRVFITKKDYIPLNENIIYINNKFYLGETEIKITNSDYFKDVSWTIAFSPILGCWMSFYDFKPNYYINHNNYFQTGINQSNSNTEFGLWSHGLTNKSYNVFYGKKYSFDVEYGTKAEYVNKQLNNVKLWTEAKRYHNEYDWAISPDITFNKSLIHNNISCSGYLNLIPQKNNFVGNKDYPKTNTDGTQDILISNKNNFEWAYDYFFDRVLNNVSNIPFINYDDNQIEKIIDTNIVKFAGKRTLERMKGDWFLNRLSYDKDSRYSLTLKFTLNETDTQV